MAVWAFQSLSPLVMAALTSVQLESTGVKGQKSTTKAQAQGRFRAGGGLQPVGSQALHGLWEEGARVKWVGMKELKKRFGK